MVTAGSTVQLLSPDQVSTAQKHNLKPPEYLDSLFISDAVVFGSLLCAFTLNLDQTWQQSVSFGFSCTLSGGSKD